MILDKYNRAHITTEEGLDLLLQGKFNVSVILDDDVEASLYSNNSEDVLGAKIQLNKDKNIDWTFEEFHEKKTKTWLIPDKYKTLDVKQYLLAKCKSKQEIDRVELEYTLYEERQFIPVLQFMIFLVDYLRENNCVWGVGRGSSVSSYILYLIGVHKIDSLKYELDIEEFLK